MNNVLIYREVLLPPSETFILSQGEALSRYSAHYVGLQHLQSLPLPIDRTHLLDFRREWRYARYWFKLFGRLSKKTTDDIDRLNPRIVHAHFATGSVEGMWLAEHFNVPLIVTFHGYDVTERGIHHFARPEWLALWLLKKKIVKRATRLLAVSDFIAGRLRALGYPTDKTFRHYIGIDPSHFRPKTPTSREDIILFVGRLVEKKGLIYLLDAFRVVQPAIPEAELIVIGDGPLRANLEGYAAAHLLRVRFLGAQPPHVVADWMSRAKLFCVPSVTASNGDSEGLGLVFLESMACGTPVVSFRHGGIPEAVVHGHTGLLYPEYDIRGLAEGITALWTNSYLWQSMSSCGQALVQNSFNLKQQNRILEQIYDNAIADWTANESGVM